MTHLLFILLGLALMAVTLPLVLELLLVTSANLLPASRRRTADSGKLPDVAIIVPAHNEEQLVPLCVQSLRAAGGPALKIYVIAHNCSDGTAERARLAGADAVVYNDPNAVGKGFALRYGFQYALDRGADAVMVVDADSVVSLNTVTAVQNAFASGARVIQCRYEMFSTTDRSSTRLAALAFRGFNVVRPRGRDRLGLSAGILGNGFAIDREVLQRVPYDAFSLVEDLEYHLHLVMAGERVRYLDHAFISADFPESGTGESVQRSRWEGGRLHTARTLFLPMLNKLLRGRPRLIEPLCDLVGMPMAFGVFALLVTVCLPVSWIRWYAAASLAVVAAHVLTAAWAGPDFFKTLQLLALSPIYILRKLWMIPGVLRGSSGKAAWVRTERNNTL
ncbi:glycosyltransferase family 2 protein [Acidicapsa ligni]|uniref:glycosyltransferase family 2 protein n=1 Tax=Acidicapsa ligni TaxID=542300 RepID=UPI0021E00DD0|nr:glycosyltransferase family 2 protein [Acidicapsa ligni]